MSTPDFIHLTVAEDVRRAANEMTQAAHRIENAMVTLNQVLYNSLNRFENLVERLETLCAEEGDETK